MAKMNSEERKQYLADLHVGVVAIERPDRAPLAVPIWYGYEPGGEVVLITDENSVKHRLIRDAGRFTLTVQDEQPPYRYVSVEGDVTDIAKVTDGEYRQIAIRYLGDTAGDQFTDENFTPTSIAIRMRPTRWLSTDYSKE